MRIPITSPLAKEYLAVGGKHPDILNIAEEDRSSRWDHDFDASLLTVKDLELLHKATQSSKLESSTVLRRSARLLKALLELRRGKGNRITNLELMVEAILVYLLPLPSHWVFMVDETYGQLLPWFVEKVEFVPLETHRGGGSTPAHILISLKAKVRGDAKEKTVRAQREHLGERGCIPSELLPALGLLVETPALLEEFNRETKQYQQYFKLRGEQFWATGRGQLGVSDDEKDNNRWWHSQKILNFERDGAPSRTVMDDDVGFGNKYDRDEVVYVDTSVWRNYRVSKEDDSEADHNVYAPVLAPVHPIVAVFSLSAQQFVEAHVSSLTPYDYQKGLAKKLVLPDDTRKLIDVLIGTATKSAEDLIRGKTGGVIILCSGAPGTGKTLTAEVYAEIAKRPLYTVQCSQLGVDSESLESSLSRVLRRSIRWNAVTLIDEADVYIHERGNDVNQNAIVGVFLRLLEYYSGVLFLTTNRATVVDDAIKSRCMAHLRYRVPDNDVDKITLWQIMAAQYGITLGLPLIKELVEFFPQVSGRTIKQFCRLARAMSNTMKVNLAMFTWLSEFQDVEGYADRGKGAQKP